MITAVEKEKIIELNEKLRIEEVRIELYYSKMKVFFNDGINNHDFDDINWSEKLCIFSSNKKFNEKYDVEEGDTFVIDFPCLLGLIKREEGEKDIFLENWSEGKLLEGMHICYLMHVLVYDCIIKIEDLQFVDDIWFEIKLDIQFMLNKNGLYL